MATSLEELKEKQEAPEFLTEEGYRTLQAGYLLPNETPLGMYKRAARYSAKNYSDSKRYESDFLDAMLKNWLCCATPILSNAETDKLQISCYSGITGNKVSSIMDHMKEMAMLTKNGGGVGSSFDLLKPISGDIVPFAKILEATIEGITQGKQRRGSVASYLNARHPNINEFIELRNPVGDLSRRCLSVAFHNAVVIDDDIMQGIKDGDKRSRELWTKINNQRVETGEPYILFEGNANKNCPDEYKGRITQSNLCSEIMAPATPEETFVCCLSSLNLAKYDEWKDYRFPNTGLTLVELSIAFLDSVITNFITQASNIDGLENAVRFAERHRMLGLGVLGWHSLLQSKMIAFDSFQAMQLNNEIFSKMRTESYAMSTWLGRQYGSCSEVPSRRNSALLAVAPTMSNSIISGGVSQGIEPITANYFAQKSAKGTFIKTNPMLKKYLAENGLDTYEVWEQINSQRGSVKNISQMNEHAKNVFLTAREINQYALIKQAAQRQRWIDQGQSLNLFFTVPSNKEDGKIIIDSNIDNGKITLFVNDNGIRLSLINKIGRASCRERV